MSFFFGMGELKHYFPTPVNYCISQSSYSDNKAMLDAKKLAGRIREAMDGHQPPITGSAVSEACGVTPQAVSGWRKNGRVHKKHLVNLAQLTGRSLDYFLGDGKVHANGGEKTHTPLRLEKDLANLMKSWEDFSPDQRSILISLAEKFHKDNAKRRKRASSD